MTGYRVIEAPRAKKDIKKYVGYLRDRKKSIYTFTAQDNCAIFAFGGAFGTEYGIHDG